MGMLILLTSRRDMEENVVMEGVKARLVFSGLKELDKHGVADFSLRRVAQDAGVSCAAPYRHFKDKDELIGAVIEFVLEGWTLLAEQICEIFSDDAPTLVSELAVAGLRFWIGNGNFRTVIVASATLGRGENGMLASFDAPIISAIEKYAAGSTDNTVKRLSFKILSMLYGAVMLVDGGFESADKAAEDLRSAIVSEL